MGASAAEKPLPFHLRGNYAPVQDEVTLTDLRVEGAIPPELRGLFVRNGPNPRSGTSAHWFVGDGMLHGIRFESGRAAWYRNRWVRTRSFTEDPSPTLIHSDGTVDRTVAVANTHIVRHAGRILALVESSYPTQVTPGLDTIGLHDFGGRLKTAMTAHPKLCPRTGEMHFFGYGFFPPYLTYHRVDAKGALVQSEEIPVKGPTMIHDFAMTERHVLFLDLPVVFDLEKAMAGMASADNSPREAGSGDGLPYHWSDDYGARIGVMPRGAGAASLRWFEIAPCYIFHPFNAFEADDGRIVLDVCRYPKLWAKNSGEFDSARPYRFTIDLAAGAVAETPLFDDAAEFPRIDDRRAGSRARYGYAAANPPVGDFERHGQPVIVKYDLAAGTRQAHDLGGRVPSEAVFAPAQATAGEDEGWLIAYAFDEARGASDVVILDAQHIERAPVATIHLPRRVPYGFHGNWFPDE